MTSADDFNLSTFINDQKWLFPAMAVFMALGFNLQSQSSIGKPQIVTIGAAASILLFVFTVYLFMKNLIDEIGGTANTAYFVTSIQRNSLELQIFLILLFTVVATVLWLAQQTMHGLSSVGQIFVFFFGASLAKMSFSYTIENNTKTKFGFFLPYLIVIWINEAYNYHLPGDLSAVFVYTLSHSNLQAFLLLFSIGILVAMFLAPIGSLASQYILISSENSQI